MSAAAIERPTRSATVTSIDGRRGVERLVADVAPDLLDYFGRRVADAEDAADLLGDALVVIWRRSASIPADATEARMWCFGVARRVLMTQRRSHARRRALAEQLQSAARVDAPAGAAPMVDEVRTLIAELDELDQEIIRLAYWEGFSLMEIASILGKRPGTVRSRHARARASLRQALESHTRLDG